MTTMAGLSFACKNKKKRNRHNDYAKSNRSRFNIIYKYIRWKNAILRISKVCDGFAVYVCVCVNIKFKTTISCVAEATVADYIENLFLLITFLI